MRKQTKVVAVASAAALLAIGASMTSFAATGWVEEDGTWYFYDRDGNRVEDEWRKSGDNWYWLDSEEGGAMAVDKLVEDDDDTYYVDSNGVMVRNTWVRVVNEEQDDDEDPAEYNYYYMQSNGKAYKAPDSANDTRFRTIDGKRYAFDDDGKMLYGWVDNGGERVTDEDDWAASTTLYYLGNWDDGAMKTGWQKITVHDDYEDDDMEYWFFFKANGRKEYRTDNDTDADIKEKTINGRKYGFDERGVMVSQWTMATSGTATDASAANWRYFNSPEDGARVTKGWFKVVAPSEDNDNVFTGAYGNATFAPSDADDEEERWYYADKDGKLAEGEIKKIRGKYYGFRPEDDGEGKGAAMLNGLVLMKVEDDQIIDVHDDGIDADELSDLLDGDYDELLSDGYTLFYFGNDEDNDGSMKTGATTVSLDGDSFNFLFSKSGGEEGRGRGMTGVDDNKYIYKAGCRIKADSDDKYQVVQVAGVKDINSGEAVVRKVSSASLRATDAEGANTFTNDDKETVRYNKMVGNDYYLVNTSGSIQKNKAAAKDGDEWFFYVRNRDVKLYSNNKNMDEDGTSRNDWKDYLTDAEYEIEN